MNKTVLLAAVVAAMVAAACQAQRPSSEPSMVQAPVQTQAAYSPEAVQSLLASEGYVIRRLVPDPGDHAPWIVGSFTGRLSNENDRGPEFQNVPANLVTFTNPEGVGIWADMLKGFNGIGVYDRDGLWGLQLGTTDSSTPDQLNAWSFLATEIANRLDLSQAGPLPAVD